MGTLKIIFTFLMLMGFAWDAPGLANDLSDYQAQAELKPKDANIQFNLGVLAYQAGDLKTSVRALEKASELSAKDPGVWELYGKVLLDLGKADEAIRALKKCLKLDKKRNDARMDLGIALSRQGTFDEAIKVFETVAKITPKDAQVYTNMGLVYLKLDDTESAVKVFEKASALDPGDGLAAANLCQIYNSLEKYQMAYTACGRAILNPAEKPAIAHYNLAFALVRLKKAKSAAEHFQKALKLDPAMASAHYNLGFIYYEAALPDKAAASFEKALATRQGDYPVARYNLAVVLGDLGRWDEAAGQYRELLKKDKDNEDARVNLQYVIQQGTGELLKKGSSAYLAGDYNRALDAWEGALKLDPDNTEAQAFTVQVHDKLKGLKAKKAQVAEDQRKARLVVSEKKLVIENKDILNQGVRALKEDRLKEAVELISHYVKNNPDDKAAEKSLYKARSRLMLRVGIILDQLEAANKVGKTKKAETLLSEALALDPKNQRANSLSKKMTGSESKEKLSQQQLQTMYLRGVQLYLRGELKESAGVWKKVLAADKNHLEARQSLQRVNAELVALSKIGD